MVAFDSLLASISANSKPDFASASKVLESCPIGKVIGFKPLCDDDENLLFAKLTKGALKALEAKVV